MKIKEAQNNYTHIEQAWQNAWLCVQHTSARACKTGDKATGQRRWQRLRELLRIRARLGIDFKM